jgi:site-specific DNA-cytosine methylase
MERENGSVGQPKEHGENITKHWHISEKRTTSDANGERLSREEYREKESKRNTEVVPNWNATYPESERLSATVRPQCDDQERREKSRGHIEQSPVNVGYSQTTNGWQNFPTVSPVRSGNDGISLGLSNITFPKWRNESIKALGNAVVPQVVLQIFKAIHEYESYPKHR